MSELPQLVASTPEVVPAKEEEEVITVIPASEEKVYDKYWVTQLSILSVSPTEEARIVATLVPCRDVTVDGVTTKELMPDADPISIVVPNLFERMATNESLALTMGAVLTELIEIGQEQGILS